MQWSCHEFHNFNAIVIACKKMFAFYAFFDVIIFSVQIDVIFLFQVIF